MDVMNLSGRVFGKAMVPADPIPASWYGAVTSMQISYLSMYGAHEVSDKYI